MSPLKFCKDCKWSLWDDFSFRCKKAPNTDPVTGQERFFFCEIERIALNGCGPEGKKWEPKESTNG